MGDAWNQVWDALAGRVEEVAAERVAVALAVFLAGAVARDARPLRAALEAASAWCDDPSPAAEAAARAAHTRAFLVLELRAQRAAYSAYAAGAYGWSRSVVDADARARDAAGSVVAAAAAAAGAHRFFDALNAGELAYRAAADRAARLGADAVLELSRLRSLHRR